jgi:hypothetical protein
MKFKSSAARGIELYREFVKSLCLIDRNKLIMGNELALWPVYLKNNYWKLYQPYRITVIEEK